MIKSPSLSYIITTSICLLHWENQSADSVAGQTTAHRSNLILLIMVYLKYTPLYWNIRQRQSAWALIILLSVLLSLTISQELRKDAQSVHYILSASKL